MKIQFHTKPVMNDLVLWVLIYYQMLGWNLLESTKKILHRKCSLGLYRKTFYSGN